MKPEYEKELQIMIIAHKELSEAREEFVTCVMNSGDGFEDGIYSKK